MIKNSFECSELRELLEDYTYEVFMEQCQRILKSGRCVWYVSGNYGHSQAIDLVEQARALFNFKTVKIEDIVAV